MIYDFRETKTVEDWQTVNDNVMGGVSQSEISLTKEGYGQFSGHVSLKNNGGFASARHLTDIHVKPNHTQIVLRLKGDGKTYQFRLKSDINQTESYVEEFKTSGEWETIKIQLSDFSPQLRGRQLDMPNFNFETIEEIRFLIANKKEQDFELIIDNIQLK
jgi:hypothetical protein